MKTIITILSLFLLCRTTAASNTNIQKTSRRQLHPKSKASKRGNKSDKHNHYYHNYHHHHRPNNAYKEKDDNNGGLMCLDLGSRGKHTIRVSSRLRSLTEFRHAKKGRCDDDDDKKFKSYSLRYMESYCREMNHKLVTIKAPRGMRMWMMNVVKAERGACRGKDEVIVMREV